jgi:hypothetical protein
MNFRLETVTIFASVSTCDTYHYRGHASGLGYPRYENHVRNLPFFCSFACAQIWFTCLDKTKKDFLLPGHIL